MIGDKFQQDWRTQKYSIVHVPKTGGTSLFAWFSRMFGAEQCLPHIESLVLPTPSAEMISYLLSFRVVSGHIPIDLFMYLAAGGFRPVTVTRDPLQQFWSHVNHILTSDIRDPFLRGIQDKLRTSPGYLLDHGSEDELAFFESPQSKPIFGGTIDWRKMTVVKRIDWLQANYAIATTTETMEAELGWLDSAAEPSATIFPKLNAKFYEPTPLTSRQAGMLAQLLREDAALHLALSQCSVGAE